MRPKFVKRFEEFFQRGVEAVKTYVDEVRDGVFPGVEHSFGMGAPRAVPGAGVSAGGTATEASAMSATSPVYGPTQ